MDFDLPGEDDPVRQEVRAWLEANPRPTGRQLAEAGLVTPHWPRPWGRDAGPIEQLVIDEELKRAKVNRPINPIGIGWGGPTIVHAGTQEQKDRYLMPLLAGEELWCQLFSEPDAGSDLATLGTRAVRDGETYVINGQKIWTSLAHLAKFGILIARTDPDAPKHQGISYFICPMDTPGITVRPIIEMTGDHLFNEVFFDDVRIPAENLVGDEHQGWALAKVTLGNERVSLSGEGALWGRGPTGQEPRRRRQGSRWVGRPGPAPATHRCVDRGRAPPAHPAAHGDGRREGTSARRGGIGAQGIGRRARSAPHEPGGRPRWRGGHVEERLTARLR